MVSIEVRSSEAADNYLLLKSRRMGIGGSRIQCFKPNHLEKVKLLELNATKSLPLLVKDIV